MPILDKALLLERVEEKQNDTFCKDNPDNFSYSRNVDGYRFSSEEFS